MAAMEDVIAGADVAIAGAVVGRDKKKRKMNEKSGLPGNHGKSEVWKYFNKHVLDGTTKYAGLADCLYCGTQIKSPSKNGTNIAWAHYNNCKKIPKPHEDKSQHVLTLMDGQLLNWKFDQEKCRRSLTRMIILDELPFSHVDGEGFRLFCEEMQPKFHVLSRITVAKDCLKIFHEERLKLKKYFQVNHTRVCLTIDLWTSIQNLGYMVITAHFVDKDWHLRKKIINFQVLPHPHKGEHISKNIESCLMEWGLDRVMTITLDNASNNDKCVSNLRSRLNKKNVLLLGGQCLHVRCFAHILNLVVRDGIEEVQDSIKRLRRAVKYVKSGSLRFQLFKQCASEEGITTKKQLCLDVKTRWNSTYLMIGAALEFERAFDRLEELDTNYKVECNVVGKEGKKLGVMEDIDWLKLKSLHAFLEEFYNITKRVSGSHYITSNAYFDEVTQVKELLMHHLHSDDMYFRDMDLKMNKKFDKYFNIDTKWIGEHVCDIHAINLILVVALVLDPRYKLEYVKFWYTKWINFDSHMSEMERKNRVDDFVKRLKELMLKLYNHYKSESDSTSFMDVDSSKKLDGDTSEPVEKATKRSAFKDEYRSLLKRKDYVDSMNDLDRYLVDCIEEGEGLDVLAWWKGKITTYREVAMMARDVLSIPLTSVASECAFSTAGRVLDPFRSSLTPTTLEALILTQDWLRTSMPSSIFEEKWEDLENIEKDVINEMGALEIGT